MTLQRILTRVLVSLLLVQALVPAARAGGQETPAPAVAGAPQASASAPVTTAPAVWLRGPFGRVAGGSLVDPATAPPGEQPLGTIVRGAPLVLEVDSGAVPAVGRAPRRRREPEPNERPHWWRTRRGRSCYTLHSAGGGPEPTQPWYQ